MRVFVTGASGWIGAATIDELLAAGHDVVGLARSERSAAALEAKGVHVQRGDLDDLDSMRAGAADADAVIHLANKHDFTDPAGSNRAERDAVNSIGEVLAGSDRPFLIASGIAMLTPGRPATEEDRSAAHGVESARGGSENLALEFAGRGVRSVSVRFAPTVHGAGDHGFIATLVGVARERGVSGYVGDGSNRWAAVHRSDAATVVRLGLEKATAGSILHAVGEEGVSAREIAEAIGNGLGVPVRSITPEDAAEHFGWVGMFFGMDIPASSTATQRLLDWRPTGATLAEDLAAGPYFSG
ncbi:SDR family oxidoreductase [Micromonospora sp. 067-2]|uniref:SDR family oxidoreductase n=1 Tax=Micromonospora sp. 067-2 TaxID=2789270 RepID=UPI00397813CD